MRKLNSERLTLNLSSLTQTAFKTRRMVWAHLTSRAIISLGACDMLKPPFNADDVPTLRDRLSKLASMYFPHDDQQALQFIFREMDRTAEALRAATLAMPVPHSELLK